MSDKKLTKDFLIYMLRSAIVLIGPLVIFPYASRILGASGIGRVQYIQSIASYFQLIATFGISSYGIREGSKIRDDKKKLSKLVSELILLNSIMTTIAFVLYLFTFRIAGLQGYTKLLMVFSLYVIFYGMNLDWVYNVFQDYVFITKRTAISYLISLIVLLLFVRDSTNELVYAFVIIIPYIGNFIFNIQGITKRLKLFDGEHLNLKQHIKPIALLFSVIISSSIYSLLDTTMLGAMLNDVAVGLYTAASKMTKLVVQLTVSMCTVFTPRLSYQIGQGNIKGFKDLAKEASNIITLIAIPCAIGLWVFSSQAIELFSGSGFVLANTTMKILSFDLIFSALDHLLGWQILVPNNKDKILLGATLTGAAVDFISNLILIPPLGVEGAAIATLVAEFSVFLICTINSKNYIDLFSLFGHILKCLIASLPIFAIGFVLSFYNFGPLLTFVIAIPIACVFYIVILFFLKEEFVSNIVKACSSKLFRK